MSIGTMVYLGLMAVVFVLWAVSMFRLLWKLNQAKNAEIKKLGRAQFGLNFDLVLKAFSSALTAPEFAPDRRRLLILTPLIFGLIAAGPLILTTPT